MTPLEQDLVDLIPQLRRYARSLSSNGADAEDLLQDCLEAAVSAQRNWHGQNLKGWVMTIMTNLSRAQWRRARVDRANVIVEETQPPAALTDRADPIAQYQLARAINALSPDHRAVLMLVVVEGYSYAEVAQMLAIPLGTVMSRLSRARQILSTVLGQDEGRTP